MILTKYQHACFTIEHRGKTVVVDPGNLSTDFIAPDNVCAVIITHQHGDHFDVERLAQIFAANDDVLILGPADAVERIEIETKKAVAPGDRVTVGPFEFEFFGGTHALIHESMPRVQNVGVLINELVYYPGDSFDGPGREIDTLAIPAAAPWMSIGQAMDFLQAINPRFVFPTHDAIYSDAGRGFADNLLGGVAKSIGADYKRLDTPVEL